MDKKDPDRLLSLVLDHITKRSGPIVFVVSPLVNLMEDQVNRLRSLGLWGGSVA